ncbi:MAG: metallophosphoesterase [Candidatus Cloacimonetes bacterium]|nr:metallophosphoesterase [Candidatus Cloacimonadota bacterium]
MNKLLRSALFPIMLLFAFNAYSSAYNAPGDTLTVIQLPILNVPAIHIPGESMPVTCLAPANTTGFSAYLVHGNKRINLPITSSTWVNTPDRWILQTTIPQVPVFELYDLEVNAAGGIHDVSQNAVSVVPSRKQNYYFVHITDLHMPTRIYYPDAGYDADSTSVIDFRMVMDDINLIRPEFVLITGDLINEGEMEGFSNQYWYGWVQNVISELQVPVYITAGNHDIGGWTSTPPSQGSSRRSWWRYFGWSWLNNTNVNWNWHTQDYSFTYNNTVFVGLEAYDNYDAWRPNIYGYESFTDQQMLWLSDTVSLFPGYNKVLFHHYDFQEELNLGALDIDLSLWGHVHYNSGSTSSPPYSLSTRSTCDGNRAYRVIRINNNTITPYNSVYAGTSGTNIYTYYLPSNTGVADSVMAIVTNNQGLSFENTLLKFLMPAGNTGYEVTNGVLEQVDRSGSKNVCYVRVNLGANTSKYVSIKNNGVANEDPLAIAAPLRISSCYPNPLSFRGEIDIFSDKANLSTTVELYNVKGQKVQQLELNSLKRGSNLVSFTPASGLGSGIYFLRLKDTNTKPYKLILLK